MTARVVDLSAFDPKANGHGPTEPPERRIRLTPASDIKIRPVFWVWEGRLARGTLGLLAGPEGVGKSTLGYWLAARITRGQLPGEYHGEPASVLVAATEDSWEHTIVPRLMAARADLRRVYRVDVITEDHLQVSLSLPKDLGQVEQAAEDVGAGLMLLDPLMSRLDPKLDTHKDGEVRTALEPLVAIADRARMAILGLIHHNKSGKSDPLELVMASKAFTAVARSVHTVIRDPDDETGERRLFGTPKNNLGRIDLPMLAFSIAGHHVGDTEEGEVWTGRLNWLGEAEGTIGEAIRRGSGTDDERSALQEAADWLADYLEVNAGVVDSADAKKDAMKAGHSAITLKRASRKLGIQVEPMGFPRRTMWRLDPTVNVPNAEKMQPDHQSDHPWGGSPEDLTGQNSSKGAGDVPKDEGKSDAPTYAHWDQQKDPAREVISLEDPEPSHPDYEPIICPGCDLPVDPTIDGETHPACDPWRNA